MLLISTTHNFYAAVNPPNGRKDDEGLLEACNAPYPDYIPFVRTGGPDESSEGSNTVPSSDSLYFRDVTKE